jgi:oxaloacetate decarboxylase alpha subunit
MLASGPLRVDPRRSASNIVQNVTDLLAEAGSLTSISVTQPGFSVAARRREAPPRAADSATN